MSYPPPLYHGDTGEVSAAFRPVGQAGELPHAHYLATGASTHGHFGLYRWLMDPHAGGPDAHFHRSISESFEVLADAARREAMDEQQRAAFMLRHDTFWV